MKSVENVTSGSSFRLVFYGVEEIDILCKQKIVKVHFISNIYEFMKYAWSLYRA